MTHPKGSVSTTSAGVVPCGGRLPTAVYCLGVKQKAVVRSLHSAVDFKSSTIRPLPDPSLGIHKLTRLAKHRIPAAFSVNGYTFISLASTRSSPTLGYVCMYQYVFALMYLCIYMDVSMHAPGTSYAFSHDVLLGIGIVSAGAWEKCHILFLPRETSTTAVSRIVLEISFFEI